MVFSGFQGYPLFVASLILFQGKAAENRSFGELTVSPELKTLVNKKVTFWKSISLLFSLLHGFIFCYIMVKEQINLLNLRILY